MESGKEVCRVGTADFERELAKGRGRKASKDLDGSRSYHLVVIGCGAGSHPYDAYLPFAKLGTSIGIHSQVFQDLSRSGRQ
jgi:hypothetical protein